MTWSQDYAQGNNLTLIALIIIKDERLNVSFSSILYWGQKLANFQKLSSFLYGRREYLKCAPVNLAEAREKLVLPRQP